MTSGSPPGWSTRRPPDPHPQAARPLRRACLTEPGRWKPRRSCCDGAPQLPGSGAARRPCRVSAVSGLLDGRFTPSPWGTPGHLPVSPQLLCSLLSFPEQIKALRGAPDPPVTRCRPFFSHEACPGPRAWLWSPPASEMPSSTEPLLSWLSLLLDRRAQVSTSFKTN